MPIPVAFVAFRVEELPRTHRSPERSFLAPFVAMPFAPSSVRSLLVVRPGAPSSVLINAKRNFGHFRLCIGFDHRMAEILEHWNTSTVK